MIRHMDDRAIYSCASFSSVQAVASRGKTTWHDFSAIHPEFAARSGVVDRAAREYLPFDAPPPRDGRLDRIQRFQLLTVRRLTGLRRCEPISALIFGRRRLIGDLSSFASGFHKINICAKAVIAG